MGNCESTSAVEPVPPRALEIRNPMAQAQLLLKPPLAQKLAQLKLRVNALAREIEYQSEKQDVRVVFRLMVEKNKLLKEIEFLENHLVENGKPNAESEGSGQQGAGVARDSGPHLRRIEEEGSHEDQEGTHCQQAQACPGQEGLVHSEEGGIRRKEGNIQAF
jgi:hypothetical protein